MTTIYKQSKLEGQYEVNLITKEDAGNFIYKITYGNEKVKVVDDLFKALEQFQYFCDIQLECAVLS